MEMSNLTAYMLLVNSIKMTVAYHGFNFGGYLQKAVRKVYFVMQIHK
jgi:hypothetical protein